MSSLYDELWQGKAAQNRLAGRTAHKRTHAGQPVTVNDDEGQKRTMDSWMRIMGLWIIRRFPLSCQTHRFSTSAPAAAQCLGMPLTGDEGVGLGLMHCTVMRAVICITLRRSYPAVLRGWLPHSAQRLTGLPQRDREMGSVLWTQNHRIDLQKTGHKAHYI